MTSNQAKKLALRKTLSRHAVEEHWELPMKPEKVYHDQWKGWEDFLGLPPKRQSKGRRRAA